MSVDTRDLLVEIGTEELPPKALLRLSEAFEKEFCSRLKGEGLSFSDSERFATPRRLAILVRALEERQEDKVVRRRGPSVAAAFQSDGSPSKAALGFARSCGTDVIALGREKNDKGEWLAFEAIQPGRSTSEMVPEMVEAALSALPIPKRMRWGDSSEEFVRPVHWVCLLFGSSVIEGKVLGIDSGGATRGHRFHAPEERAVSEAGDYARVLRVEGWVEPSFEVRRARVTEKVKEIASAVGGHAHLGADLVDEVTALVEWPVPLVGRFDEEFLDVPREVLVETMQSHQKYFAVFDEAEQLMPVFVTVSNIESKDPDAVRLGNERVIRPRFSDAAFFWKQDLSQPLSAYQQKLSAVVFQAKLGTLADKSARVSRIAVRIADELGVAISDVERACALAKCDLVTSMIGEFPSLQGTMGRYYAERSGEAPDVCAAMEEQYLPRYAGDSLPETGVGTVIALAERLDTLVGIFAIGERPTGAKDAFGLRRASIGVIRILIEKSLSLDLRSLLDFTGEGFAGKIEVGDAPSDVFHYCLDRLKAYYQEQGIGSATVEAVLCVGAIRLDDVDRRVRAVESFRQLDEAVALAAANKRIQNILKKSADLEVEAGGSLDRLVDPAEIRLAKHVSELREAVAPLFAAGDYEGVLKALAKLRPDVDAFFDEVLVMAEDLELRRMRLTLLSELKGLFFQIADISRLQ